MGFIDLTKTGLSGRIGPIVAYVVDGKQMYRTYTKTDKPKTENQKANQSKFGLVSSSISPLYKVIKEGFKDEKITFGGVCGKISREAVTGVSPDYKIDYSKIQIAKGDIKSPENISCDVDKDAKIVTLSWEPMTSSPGLRGGEDKFQIVCFNESFPKEIITINKYSIDMGEAAVEIPERWNLADTHLWVYIKSWDGERNSDSVYFTIATLGA